MVDLLGRTRTSEAHLATETVQDVLDRFILWTGNLGALHQPHKRSSLESRLARFPEVQDQICEQLEDLEESIRECH